MKVLRGVHINKWTDGAKRVVVEGRPGLVKSLDQNPEIFELKEQQGFFYVARRHFDKDAWWQPTPKKNAEYLFGIMDREFRAYKDKIDCILTPWNERGQRPEEGAEGHARAVLRFVELAHAEGYKVGGPNFSVGNPEPEQMNVWEEALAALDYVVLHEYWSWPGPYFNKPWWIGRWKRLLDALPEEARKPVILGECGIDNQLLGKTVDVGGWRDAGINGEVYARQLEEFYQGLDERVVGLCLFNTGDHSNQMWKSFEYGDTREVIEWIGRGPAFEGNVPSEEPVEGVPVIQLPEQRGVWKVERVLHPWPDKWNQLDDWSTDENGDQNRYNNCGPESISATLKYLTGVELSADEIVETMDNNHVGYTTVEQLTAWLTRYAEIETETHYGNASTLLRPVVEEAIDNGYPVVVLFFFDINDANSGHFCPVYGYNDSGIYRHQVYGGGTEFMAWEKFEAWQKLGTCFVVKRRRDAQLPAFRRAA